MDPENCLQEESCRHFLHQKDAMAKDPKKLKVLSSEMDPAKIRLIR